MNRLAKAFRNRSFRLFIAVLLTATVAPQMLNVRPVSADDGGYYWANATYVDANYDWGYNPCPTNDTGCMAMTDNGYGTADPWVYNLRNCTSYAAWKINQVFGVTNITGWGNADTWDTGYTKAQPYPVYSPSSYTPQVGDLAQWDGTLANPAGHVAYVYAMSGGIASLDEYNAAGTGLFSSNRTTASGSAGIPSHYIHIGTPNGGGGNISNLVKNGGFELGTTSWNIMPSTNFVIYSNGQPASTDVAFSGTHFAATNALQSNGSFYQDIPVTANAGDVFCADAEMRTQTGSPAPTVDTLGLFLLGGTTVDIGSRAYTNLPNDGSTWLNEKTCVTATVTQPTLRVQIFPEVNGGTTDVDNVDVHKSLARNSGFELGTTYWNIMPGTNFVAYSNGQPTSTDQAYSGTRFAATNTGQSNGSFYQDIPVTATAGDTYCADAEMRTQTGSPSSAADTLGVFLLGGSAIDVGSHDYSGLPNDGSSWVNEKSCVTATVAQTTLRVQVYPQVNGTTVDIDNIDLHKSLAHNGGFELTTAYWNTMPGTNFVIYSNGQPTATDKAFSGTKFAASNALQSNGSFYQDIPVAANPGDEYCVDAEMRTQTGSPAPTVDTLGVYLLGGSAVDGGTHPYTNLPNDGSSWLNEKTCVTASVAQTTLRVQVFPEVNGGTTDVDNIDVH